MTTRYFKVSNSREFSQWLHWAQNTYFSCCCCGLTHLVQLRLRLNKSRTKCRVEVRMKECKGRTAKRRAIMKRDRTRRKSSPLQDIQR